MSEKECNCGCGHDHDHDCDCGHDHEEMDTIFLTLDDDTEMECHIIGTFDVEEKEYIALLPFDEDAVLIYSFTEKDEELELSLIEDDAEFEKVSAVFYEIFDEDEEGEE